MAKSSRGRRRIASQQCRTTPYQIHCNHNKKEEKKDWKDATCSVCMECPHNAVLLLCSSHDKGCRPYMCGTSLRYSNCLDQYKKAYTKVTPSRGSESVELACPLCRGQVKGWTVVEPAREFLNSKKRSCMNENCSFSGTYKELRKHVKAEHPSARPRQVDPALEQKWRRFERERERDDVISIMRSSMPGAAMFFGDYAVEGDEAHSPHIGFNRNMLNMFFLLHAFGQSGNTGFRQSRQSAVGARRTSPVADLESSGGGDDTASGGGMSLVNRLRRQGRVLLGRSGRRRRRRASNGGRR